MKDTLINYLYQNRKGKVQLSSDTIFQFDRMAPPIEDFEYEERCL